ncbi:MAG: hypothetical protein ACLQBX_03270 [Candidatus Limnocylindrales bacterium]
MGTTAERALEWLTTLAETWQHADVPEAKAELLHAIDERYVVAGREMVSARLTPAASEHGVALALPEEVQVAMALPAELGRPLATCHIAIDGRHDRLAAVQARSA